MFLICDNTTITPCPDFSTENHGERDHGEHEWLANCIDLRVGVDSRHGARDGRIHLQVVHLSVMLFFQGCVGPCERGWGCLTALSAYQNVPASIKTHSNRTQTCKVDFIWCAFFVARFTSIENPANAPCAPDREVCDIDISHEAICKHGVTIQLGRECRACPKYMVSRGPICASQNSKDCQYGQNETG